MPLAASSARLLPDLTRATHCAYNGAARDGSVRSGPCDEDHAMTMRMTAAVLIAGAILPMASAHAGPCTAQLDALQPKIDALIEATAAQGGFGTQSTAATQRRQPTPNSIATAEAQLGEGKGAQAATGAMSDARAADASGNAAGCAQAITQIEAALKSQ
jgi:hypothetical protein